MCVPLIRKSLKLTLHSDDGIVPVRDVSIKIAYAKFVKLPSVLGIDPVIGLEKTRREVRELSNPISDGISPDILL